MDKASWDSKVAELMAFRKANGLCYTCGEKWTRRGHKCPEHVPIHLLQELLGLLHISSDEDSDSSDTKPDCPEDCVMAVQKELSAQPPKSRKTLRFRGFVGKQELLILLDSGSAGTFISQHVAQKFQSSLLSCDELHFTTADGCPMLSNQQIPHFQWCIQGHSFSYPTRVLPLQCFDMILGADWLAEHSPTWIDWKSKVM